MDTPSIQAKFLPTNKFFSLVSSEERSSVFECVFSDASVGKGLDVLDILPTTDFLAQIIRENMTPERRKLNYFTFDAGRPCDVSGLTLAFSNLFMRIKSLCTGLARPRGQRLLQVAYRKW
ncbi:hypothetical protein CC78DRAFT_588286 [Lojkania enalia]|uniref:Uncharacterized protein n=1 Tax=Lojkania enalia TaxID=147567 RepID=A0A9P4MUA8_9PLEO|nr:hypothetical protein CC78DRAFT_588286 [Didymosphaeria enalia]